MNTGLARQDFIHVVVATLAALATMLSKLHCVSGGVTFYFEYTIFSEVLSLACCGLIRGHLSAIVLIIFLIWVFWTLL